MRKHALALGGVGLILAATGVSMLPLFSSPEVPVLDVGKDFPVRNAQNEEVALCPWRAPDADRKRFFPAATAVHEETLILTRSRARIARLLRRQPTGQENALQIHRCVGQDAKGEHLAGIILTRCVSGESGLIELVLAVDERGRVRGARLQRLREPEAVARELQSTRFLNAFCGKTAASDWKADRNLTAVSSAAHTSAEALADGARTALILLQVGEQIAETSARRPLTRTGTENGD